MAFRSCKGSVTSAQAGCASTPSLASEDRLQLPGGQGGAGNQRGHPHGKRGAGAAASCRVLPVTQSGAQAGDSGVDFRERKCGGRAVRGYGAGSRAHRSWVRFRKRTLVEPWEGAGGEGQAGPVRLHLTNSRHENQGRRGEQRRLSYPTKISLHSALPGAGLRGHPVLQDLSDDEPFFQGGRPRDSQPLPAEPRRWWGLALPPWPARASMLQDPEREAGTRPCWGGKTAKGAALPLWGGLGSL